MLGGTIPGLAGRSYSEQTAREIDCAVRDIVGAAFEQARGILGRNGPLLREAAARLLESEVLDAKALAPFFEKIQA
jgi:cell division protease FtsH